VNINWKWWAGMTALALILYFVTQRPEWSAQTVHVVGGHLKEGADRIALFVTNIFT
jgi:hypothetical protein